jgi:hypothetical protein
MQYWLRRLFQYTMRTCTAGRLLLERGLLAEQRSSNLLRQKRLLDHLQRQLRLFALRQHRRANLLRWGVRQPCRVCRRLQALQRVQLHSPERLLLKRGVPVGLHVHRQRLRFELSRGIAAVWK